MIGIFDLFKIGIGPSSSPTVGLMKAAFSFVEALDAGGFIGRVAWVCYDALRLSPFFQGKSNSPKSEQAP